MPTNLNRLVLWHHDDAMMNENDLRDFNFLGPCI